MLFNSSVFILFLIIVLPIYYSVSIRWQNLFLIAASYFFYGYWDYRFLPLIVISTFFNYFLALKINKSENAGHRKIFLVTSLMLNFGCLGFFKYFNFFIDSFAVIIEKIGFNPSIHTLNIILPIGISFYTFQVTGYIIDVYRKKQTATPDFISFALYICYFPQLVAGPIERAQRLLPKIQAKRCVTKEDVYTGLQLMLIGYVQKIAIADAVAPFVNKLFANPAQFMSIDLLCGVYLFSLQIYGDFAGYSNIARGVSRLMGIDLMINFKQPYLSKNISEFWRRWHISLSTWFRDYLYIPLGGNKKGAFKTYQNLFITMLLCGLWHGASWAFVFWGGLHGTYLAIYRLIKNILKDKPILFKNKKFSYLINILITFHLVAFAWIFFRAPDFTTAYTYINILVNPSNFIRTGNTLILIYTTAFYLLFVLALDVPLFRTDRETLVTEQNFWVWRGIVFAGLILIISFLGESNVQPFIYFQF